MTLRREGESDADFAWRIIKETQSDEEKAQLANEREQLRNDGDRSSGGSGKLMAATDCPSKGDPVTDDSGSSPSAI